VYVQAIKFSELVALCISVLTLFTMIAAGVAWGFKYIALPWLKTHLVQPVNEVNKQVSVNNFVSKEPTMADRVHAVSDKVDSLDAKVDGVEDKVNTTNNTLGILSGVWEHQIDFTNDEFKRVWAAIHNRHSQGYEGKMNND
jgi:hypothetical protein